MTRREKDKSRLGVETVSARDRRYNTSDKGRNRNERYLATPRGALLKKLNNAHASLRRSNAWLDEEDDTLNITDLRAAVRTKLLRPPGGYLS